MKYLYVFMILLFSKGAVAGCELQDYELPISCAETYALLEKLPTVSEFISSESEIRKLVQKPYFDENKGVSSITVELEFEPHWEYKGYSTYTYARCSSNREEKTEWLCYSTNYNEYVISKKQPLIKFHTEIDDRSAREIISLIDSSSELWPRTCYHPGLKDTNTYISSVSYNGSYYSVSFCTGHSSGNTLQIKRDMRNLKLYIDSVGEWVG
jgi:hypothetical protein